MGIRIRIWFKVSPPHLLLFLEASQIQNYQVMFYHHSDIERRAIHGKPTCPVGCRFLYLVIQKLLQLLIGQQVMSYCAVHLLASAGLDGAVYVWNVWGRDKKKVRAFNYHNAPVKDVKWSRQGLSMLSCGYDCSSRLVDVEKGLEIQNFKEEQVVGVVKFHPDNYNMFLSGGSKGSLRLWDIRTNKVVHEYIRDLGAILDVEFVNDGERFISSSDVSGGNLSENAIIVWDISREIPLSNQVYTEAYTCPCIKRHPRDSIFVAQSNGNYIAIFSTNPPFKLNKCKRYESHWVSGFPIKCSFSVDGETLVSGSSDGSIYIYGYKSSELMKKLKAYEQPCVGIAHHPVLRNVIASCSWNGEVSVFE